MRELFISRCKLAFAGIVMLTAVLAAGKPGLAKAGVVMPSVDKDSYNIQHELDTTGSVTLVNGATYRLNNTIILRSNMNIEAAGATIICEKPIAFNIPDTVNYSAAYNISINGGTWKSESDGYYGSSFKFTHASNLKFTNMVIRAANFSGHSLELVACRDVLIDSCDISGLGESSSMTEEAVQLDLASSATAPFLGGYPFNTGLSAMLWNNAGCKNVTITNSTIVGNRGVVANHTKDNNEAMQSIHENVTLINNNITGLKGEGVALFNTKSAKIKGNKIRSLREGMSDAYTVGLHITTFSSDSELNKADFKIRRNTIYGGRQAINIYSHTSVKFGRAIIERNKLFCKAGENAAINAKDGSVEKVFTKSNVIKAYSE